MQVIFNLAIYFLSYFMFFRRFLIVSLLSSDNLSKVEINSLCSLYLEMPSQKNYSGVLLRVSIASSKTSVGILKIPLLNFAIFAIDLSIFREGSLADKLALALKHTNQCTVFKITI